MKHTIELGTNELQYIRAALGRYKHSKHYPTNDRHFKVVNYTLVSKLESEIIKARNGSNFCPLCQGE